MAKHLLKNRTIATAQNDVGSSFRIDTTDEAFVSSWMRPSNDIMVTDIDKMIPMENMLTNQVLRAGCRSDLPNRQTRLCLSYMIAGMFASAFLRSRGDLSNDSSTGIIESLSNLRDDDLIAPLIVDLIPVIDRSKGMTEEDFCDDNGNVSIHPGMPLAMKRMSYILCHYSKIFSEGDDVWEGFMHCICKEGHTVKVLSDKDIAVLDPQLMICV